MASGMGGFLSGLAGGILTGQQMSIAKKREERLDKADKRADAAESRAQETHQLDTEIKQIGVRKARREEPLHEREITLRGLKLDYETAEQQFSNTMQEFEQGTRRLLAQGQRGQAQAGVDMQGDQIALAREQLNASIADTVQRQTANVWGVLQSGNTDVALDMFNKSKLLLPGQKAKGFALEDVDVPGADGKSAGKAKVLTINLEGGGKKQIPVAALDALRQKYGAQYKVVGKDLVRIGADGQATPIHSSDEYAVVPEGGSMASRRTGKPAAASGTAGAPGTGRPPGSDKATGRVDDRVKQGTAIVNRYFGVSEFTGLDPKNQAKYAKINDLMGAKVRGGMHPEAAAKAAIDEVSRAEASAAPGAPGAPYNGPTPWRR
jgi:hypothetical protein